MPVADTVDHIHPVRNSFEVYELYHKDLNALKVFLSKIYCKGNASQGIKGNFAGATKMLQSKIRIAHTLILTEIF